MIDWWCLRAISESIGEKLGEKWYPFILRVINECFSSRLSAIDPQFAAGSVWSAGDHISAADRYMWLAHRREGGVAEAEGCVWNSDQWIDYANADQMYWLTTTFSVWMLLTNHSALVTHAKLSRGERKGPILWPFFPMLDSIGVALNDCVLSQKLHRCLSVCFGPATNLLTVVALPQENKSTHFPLQVRQKRRPCDICVCGLFTCRPLRGTIYTLLSQKIMMHISRCK